MMHIFLDDMRPGPAALFDDQNNDFYIDWVIVRRIENVKVLLQAGLVVNMSLDNDMGQGEGNDGVDLLRWMLKTDTLPRGKIAIHTGNGEAAKEMLSLITSYEKIKQVKLLKEAS